MHESRPSTYWECSQGGSIHLVLDSAGGLATEGYTTTLSMLVGHVGGSIWASGAPTVCTTTTGVVPPLELHTGHQ